MLLIDGFEKKAIWIAVCFTEFRKEPLKLKSEKAWFDL
jgi:hypothetical protein